MPSLAGHSLLYPIIHGRVLTIPTFKGRPQEEEPEQSLPKSAHKGGKKSLDAVTELRRKWLREPNTEEDERRQRLRHMH